VLALTNAPDAGAQLLVAVLFGVSIVLHLLWSPLFFNLRRPNWALIEVPFPWLSAVALMVALASFAPMASWLLLPAPGGLRCRSQSHHRPDEPTVWGYRLAIESERRSGAFPCGEDTLARLPTSG